MIEYMYSERLAAVISAPILLPPIGEQSIIGTFIGVGVGIGMLLLIVLLTTVVALISVVVVKMRRGRQLISRREGESLKIVYTATIK